MISKIDLYKGVFVTILWGINFSFIEIGLKDLDPFNMTFLRFLFCVFPLAFFIKKPANISWFNIALHGFLFGAGLWWIVNLAMYNGLSPGLSSVFLQFSAFFTIILSRLFFKERLSLRQIAGMIISFCGLLLITVFSNENSTKAGIFLVIIAAISWSFCNIIIKYYKPSDMAGFIVWSSLFSAPMIFLLTLAVKGREVIFSMADHINYTSFLSVLFQSYVTTIFGFIVWNNLLKKYNAASVAPLSLIVPVSGIITSYLVFDEKLGYDQLLSVAVIIFGIYIFLDTKKRVEIIS